MVGCKHQPGQDDREQPPPGHWWAQPRSLGGESGACLPRVHPGDESVIHLDTASSLKGSQKIAQCHSNLRSFFPLTPFKAMFFPHKASRASVPRIPDLEPSLYTEGRYPNQNINRILMAQWLRIHLPVQGTQVRALVREDATCHTATKPMRHNY